jgi:hypothetical protein
MKAFLLSDLLSRVQSDVDCHFIQLRYNEHINISLVQILIGGLSHHAWPHDNEQLFP